MEKPTTLFKLEFFGNLIQTNSAVLVGFCIGLFLSGMAPMWSWIFGGGWLLNVIYSSIKYRKHQKQLIVEQRIPIENLPTDIIIKYGLDDK